MGRIATIVSAHRLPIVALVLIGTAGLMAPACRADGALALAKPQDVNEGGWAIGIAWNFRSRGEAQTRSMTECRSAQDAPEETRKLCAVTTSFRNQCASVARVVDAQGNKSGTDAGFGWAVANSKKAAEEQAMTMCAATDRQGNSKLCKVTLGGCDGSAR